MAFKVDTEVKEQNGSTSQRSDTWNVDTLQDAFNNFNQLLGGVEVNKVTFTKQ